MQLDSHSWFILILNFTMILTFSLISFRLIKHTLNISRVKKSKNEFRQVTLNLPISIFSFKKYLVIRRMLKQDNDDDLPFRSSLALLN